MATRKHESRWLLAVASLGACGGRSLLGEENPETAPPARASTGGIVASGPEAGEPSSGGAAGTRCHAGSPAGGCAPTARLAAIGDYGLAGPTEESVATLVRAYGPEAIITTGDNNYLSGEAATIDANIGQYYGDYICPYSGSYGSGASVNRFFPSLGNHDWYAFGAQPYLEYFTLPGNERYYDFARGDAHFFAIDSDANEPDGVTSDSVQALWLRDRLAASSARWKIVYMHEAPYGSGVHGSNVNLRWPYREWGADLVLNGHNHVYERVEVDGFPYVTDGLGGGKIQEFGTPIEGSVVRYNQNHGAVFIAAEPNRLAVRFIAVDWTLVDELILTKP